MSQFARVLLTCLALPTEIFAEATKPIVTAQKAETIDLSDEVTYPARVTSQVNANVLAEIDGVVVEVHRPIGSSVKPGTPIISIKNTDPVYEYVPVQVKSAVGGVISAQDISVGSMVQRGQVISVVTDPSKLTLKLEVTSADAPFIKAGLEGKFSQPHLAKPISFIVKGVSPMVDPATGTATVEMINRDGASKSLSVGSIGKLVFNTNPRRGIVIPEQALVYRGKDVLVRTVSENKVGFKKVVLGPAKRGSIEILSGLAAGDHYIVQSSSFVSEGQEVTVQIAASDVAKK